MNIDHNTHSPSTDYPEPSKVIQSFRVLFKPISEPWQLEGLLQRLSQKINPDQAWFHDQWDLVHKRIGKSANYPLLQFKIKFHHAYLVCFADIAEAAQAYFTDIYPKQWVNSPEILPALLGSQMHYHIMRVWSVVAFKYRIYNYAVTDALAGHPCNFSRLSEKQQFEFLEQHLGESLYEFAEGIGWQIDHGVMVKQLGDLKSKHVNHFGTKQEAFTFTFASNIYLPDMAGLGIGAEHGLGIVRTLQKKH